jgi:hypothetical protein
VEGESKRKGRKYKGLSWKTTSGETKKKTEKTCLGVRNVFFLLLLGNPGEKKLKKKRRWREREKEDGVRCVYTQPPKFLV